MLVCISATRKNSSSICLNSMGFDLRKFRRAGILKNKFFTAIDVPLLHWHTDCSFISEPSITILVPSSLSFILVFSSTCATAAIDANASPLKPMVRITNKSCASRILEVAWRSKHSRASVSDIPQPSSITCIRVRPASLIISFICFAPASIAFSNNSFTAEAGR